MYGLGGGGTTGITTTTAGVAGVTLLPNTGSFRVMFIVAVITMTIGIITLIATGALKLKKSLSHNAQ